MMGVLMALGWLLLTLLKIAGVLLLILLVLLALVLLCPLCAAGETFSARRCILPDHFSPPAIGLRPAAADLSKSQSIPCAHIDLPQIGPFT